MFVVCWGPALAQESGPQRNDGTTVARPRKSTSTTDAPAGEQPQPKIPSQYKRPPAGGAADASVFTSNVDMVTVDVAVVDNRGQFIPGIPAGNFRVLEDSVPQKINGVEPSQAPMTVALVIEWSNLFQTYGSSAWRQTLQLAWGFVGTLKADDYVAVVAYDIKPTILSDFTTDRDKTQEALQRLTFAGFSECNLFDALTDTAERMSEIPGRKAIVLISSGIDTLSKLTLDKARKRIQQAGVPIYSIGLMQTLRELADARGGLGAIDRMEFLQADNQMRTFSNESGGGAYFPRFDGEFNGIFRTIRQALRNQYVLTYSPSNTKHDGTFRKIKVELVNPATNEPLAVKDEKGKAVKYQIIAKPGYTAPRTVE
jgi:Ca-activated chloride channel homolog